MLVRELPALRLQAADLLLDVDLGLGGDVLAAPRSSLRARRSVVRNPERQRPCTRHAAVTARVGDAAGRVPRTGRARAPSTRGHGRGRCPVAVPGNAAAVPTLARRVRRRPGRRRAPRASRASRAARGWRAPSTPAPSVSAPAAPEPAVLDRDRARAAAPRREDLREALPAAPANPPVAATAAPGGAPAARAPCPAR